MKIGTYLCNSKNAMYWPLYVFYYNKNFAYFINPALEFGYKSTDSLKNEYTWYNSSYMDIFEWEKFKKTWKN